MTDKHNDRILSPVEKLERGIEKLQTGVGKLIQERDAALLEVHGLKMSIRVVYDLTFDPAARSYLVGKYPWLEEGRVVG